jgi:DNA-binding LytR/AlgR family response regulator
MLILIADDERPARSELKHILLDLLPDCTLVEANSGSEAIDRISEETFDLLFLDIDLGDMTGTSLAVVARRLQPDTPIVFATAYQDHAIKAFELGVCDYILKPFDPKRIEKTLQRLHELPKEQLTTKEAIPLAHYEKLSVNCDKKIVLVPLKEILYIETDGRGCLVHTLTHTYTDANNIGTLEKKLEAYAFFRIHKSYLINLEHIKEIFPWQKNGFALTMEGKEKNILPIGRNQLKILRTLLDF